MLLERWPEARILGIDASSEMIRLARRRAVPDRLRFELADVRQWRPDQPFDLVLSNACLHWIENHNRLLDLLLTLMSPTSTLAFQVPANHDQPSHTAVEELCASDRWLSLLGDVIRWHVQEPSWYLEELEARGLVTTAWQTTYLHRLTGADPVLEWVKGTTLRPALERLDDRQADEFLSELARPLREAYSEREGVTLFPFKRTFVVAARG